MNTIASYKRITENEREEISRFLSQGCTQKEIAKMLARHPSTISREIRRSGTDRWTYRANSAQEQTREERHKQGRKKKIQTNRLLRSFVHVKLKKKWSPEQISKTLKEEYAWNMQISHETIYTYIYMLPRGALKSELIRGLRQERKYRQKKHKHNNEQETRGKISEMLSITERPEEVEDRIVPGHWEGDLILGKYKQSAIATLVERTTRLTLLVHLKSKDATSVRKALERKMKTIPSILRKTLTYDQGKEMSQHKLFTKNSKMQVYFADPGSPWQRGTNENTNGLIRQFFPKGTDFNTVSPQKLRAVQDLLNGRPRKAIGFKTPEEVFSTLLLR